MAITNGPEMGGKFDLVLSVSIRSTLGADDCPQREPSCARSDRPGVDDVDGEKFVKRDVRKCDVMRPIGCACRLGFEGRG